MERPKKVDNLIVDSYRIAIATICALLLLLWFTNNFVDYIFMCIMILSSASLLVGCGMIFINLWKVIYKAGKEYAKHHIGSKKH